MEETKKLAEIVAVMSMDREGDMKLSIQTDGISADQFHAFLKELIDQLVQNYPRLVTGLSPIPPGQE